MDTTHSNSGGTRVSAANTWITRGFEAFRRGTFGNAGQNLYVSRNGVLQRIHLYDLNRDGWFDLVFCNAQDHWEQPPTFVYRDVFGGCARQDLPSDGAITGVLADLNGDGFDDLVLGMQNNGIERELNAFIYYGSPDGAGDKWHARIPAPMCNSVAAGDFNGDGRADLAMICDGRLRLFYAAEIGIEPWRHADLDVDGTQLAAADLDGDGFADLYVLRKGQPPRVYWGGPDGISLSRFSDLPVQAAATGNDEGRTVSQEEGSQVLEPLARIIELDDRTYLFVPQEAAAQLVPVEKDRRFGAARTYDVGGARAVAVANLWGNGPSDLIFACGGERSWILPGGDESRRIAIPSQQACDVAAGDLDGDGRDEFVLCQYRDAESYSLHALAYKANGNHLGEPVKLPSDGARRVLIGRLSREPLRQVVLVNQFSRNATGRMPPVIYWGSPERYAPDRRTELTGIGCVSAVGCDVNDDGTPDLLTVNCAENAIYLDPGSYVFLGRKAGFDPNPDLVLPTRTAMGVVVGDIDRDGYLDAIFSSFSTHEILIFRGTEQGFDVDHPQRIPIEENGVRYTEGRRMCLADLDNDGWLDLVLTFKDRDRTFILWGGPDGFSFERKQTLSVIRPSTPVVADLTGNGYLDLIIGGHKRSDHGPHDSFVYLYWNGPDGLRTDRRTQLPAHAVLGLALADFNNDGVLDLFVANYSTGRERDLDSYLYWGKRVSGAESIFSPQRMTPIRTHSAAACVAADFDGDGRVDLAIANHKTLGDHLGESWVVRNGPDGLDFANPVKLPTAGPHGMYNNPPGNQRDRGDEEFYVSEPFRMPDGARIRSIDWNAELPPKTWVRAQIRFADTPEALERSPWLGPAGAGSWFEGQSGARPAAAITGPWIQYRLALGAASGGTPRVSEVRVGFE